MTPLERSIKDCEIDHPTFKALYELLCGRVDAALNGGVPKITIVIAPSRSGKSRLLLALLRKYLATSVNGKRVVPVAGGEVDSSTTPKELPEVVLKALRAPVPKTRKSVGWLTDHMYEQIVLAACIVMLYDEASHVVSPGARVLPYAAAQWFKQTQTKTMITQILFGVQRLTKLVEADDQFRLRCYKPIVWRPYDPIDEFDAYATAVNTFLELFRREGWTFEDRLNVLAPNCYLHSPGQIGSLSDLMQELARCLANQTPRPITMSDFAAAASVLEGAGLATLPPFVRKDVSPVELNQAYRHLLSANELS